MSHLRPMLKKTQDRASQEKALAASVKARDGGICQFEIRRGRRWVRCGAKDATDTAHVYPRRECAKAEFDQDVCIRACRACHNAYDKNHLGECDREVRVNPLHEARAWAKIVAMSKVPPRRRIPDA